MVLPKPCCAVQIRTDNWMVDELERAIAQIEAEVVSTPAAQLTDCHFDHDDSFLGGRLTKPDQAIRNFGGARHDRFGMLIA